MRKEFIPREYELILLPRLKHIKQGSKFVQSYHDELSLAMCRANIVDDIVAKEYFREVSILILLLQSRESMQEVCTIFWHMHSKKREKLKSCGKKIFQSALICAKTLLQGYMLS
jgi:hypothetical protein